MDIDDKQLFSYDKAQSDKSEFVWKFCPEYIGSNNDIYSTNPVIRYYFYNDDDYNDFIDKVGRKPKNKTLWYPIKPENKSISGYYTTKIVIQPQYPMYIVSFKRSDTLYTILSLEELGIKNYYVVIRPTENEPENYKKAMKKHKIKNIEKKLMVLPEEFIREQETDGEWI
jgi:hypothetical protein